MRFANRIFTGERVILDDHEYVDCKFTNCTLVFGGGKYSLTKCGLDGTFALSLEGLAANTLMLMQLLASHPGGRQYIIGMLDPRNFVAGMMSGRVSDAPSSKN